MPTFHGTRATNRRASQTVAAVAAAQTSQSANASIFRFVVSRRRL
jgi:hypothetical protein